jgi:hypothetical protein
MLSGDIINFALELNNVRLSGAVQLGIPSGKVLGKDSSTYALAPNTSFLVDSLIKQQEDSVNILCVYISSVRTGGGPLTYFTPEESETSRYCATFTVGQTAKVVATDIAVVYELSSTQVGYDVLQDGDTLDVDDYLNSDIGVQYGRIIFLVRFENKGFDSIATRSLLKSEVTLNGQVVAFDTSAVNGKTAMKDSTGFILTTSTIPPSAFQTGQNNLCFKVTEINPFVNGVLTGYVPITNPQSLCRTFTVGTVGISEANTLGAMEIYPNPVMIS